MKKIGKKRRKRKRHNNNIVYDKKNIDLDLKLQIWLLFGLEQIKNKHMQKWLKQ